MNTILGSKCKCGRNTLLIRLTKQKFSIIHQKDYIHIMNYKWHTQEDDNKRTYYARSKILNSIGNRKPLLMHRLIMQIDDSKIYVDHINGNGLDNRKCNLRLCGHHQNLMNRKLNKNNTSGYKGVYWYKSLKKWKAQFNINKKRVSLGYFKNKEDAALTYNKAAKKYFGDFANLNIIKKGKKK